MFCHQMSFRGKLFPFDFSFVGKGMWTSFQFSEGNWLVLHISGKESWLLPQTMYLNYRNLKCKKQEQNLDYYLFTLTLKEAFLSKWGKPEAMEVMAA